MKYTLKQDFTTMDAPIYIKAIANSLLSTFCAMEGWRIEAENEGSDNYQYTHIRVKVYKPRKHKPTAEYGMVYDTFRECILRDYTVAYYVTI